MDRIVLNSSKFFGFIDNLNPKNSGIFFSIFFHLLILLSAVGLPNLFGPKDIYVPNIIPIEILNISDTTNINKSESKNQENQQTISKQKKFNSSENTEIQKQFDIKENLKNIDQNNQSDFEIKQKKNIEIKEKKITETKTKIETIKTNEIKPKLKPKPNILDVSTKL